MPDEALFRIGSGYDVHRLVEGRPLILGGIRIAHAKGLLGHSDADVLVHAIMDAILGAAALGDIGRHFPDTDPSYAGADSLKLLARVAVLVGEVNCRIVNIDATIIAEAPKIAAHLPKMAAKIEEVLRLPAGRVNVKATTEEGLGFTGSGEGIAAQAVAMLVEVKP